MQLKNEFQDFNLEEQEQDHKPKPENERPSTPPVVVKKAQLSLSNMNTEIIAFLFNVAKQILMITDQNLLMEKSCAVNLNFSQTVCEGLIDRNASAYTAYDENAVQKQTAVFMAYKPIISTIIPFILLMTLGSWSDKVNRRKPCILLPLIGEIVSCCGSLFTVYFYSLPAQYTVVMAAVPSALGGGFYLFFMGIYTYVGSLSDTKLITLKIAILTVAVRAGYTVGIGLSGVTYKYLGCYKSYSICIVLYLVGLAMAMSIQEQSDKKSFKFLKLIKDIFDFRNVINTFKVLFKSRPNGNRLKLNIILIISFFVNSYGIAENIIIYMFTRKMFLWNEVNYSIYVTINFILQITGASGSILINHKYFNWNDGLLGVISCLSKFMGSIIHTLATKQEIFYFGTLGEILSSLGPICVRSASIKIINTNEIAKLTSIISITDAVGTMLFSPLYPSVYKLTLDVYPNAFFLLSVMFIIPNIILFYWLHKKLSSEKNENEKNQIS